MTKLVVGLGNPGSKYSDTRHNIGWMALDETRYCRGEMWKSKFKGEYLTKDIGGEKVIFLKPQTFMNLSGESVLPAAQFFKVDIKDILVIHDELDLPYGTVTFKNGGGLAGHNGLKSMAQCFGKQDFKRLRLGIGRPPFGSVSNWVLGKFSNDEAPILGDYLDLAAQAVETFVEKGFESAAREFSKKTVIK